MSSCFLERLLSGRCLLGSTQFAVPSNQSHSLFLAPGSHASLQLASCVKHVKQKEIKGHNSGWLVHEEHKLLFRNTSGVVAGSLNEVGVCDFYRCAAEGHTGELMSCWSSHC